MKSILFLLILISSQSFADSNIGKVVGQIGLVEGDVLVDSKPVQKNAPVREGSVIEVKKGHATVILGKGSVFNIAEDSKMVVTQYAVKSDTQPESGELDLKFGRTRALIFNPGNEKKDIRIKSRAATMGVRGTEIYVDCPKDAAKPVQFFTLEGKAEVRAFAGAAPVPVGQNQGVSTSGVAPASSGNTSGGAKSEGSSSNAKGNATTASNPGATSSNSSLNGASTTAAPAAGSASTSTGDVAPSSITVAEVKADIAKSGMEPAPPVSAVIAANNPPPPNRAAPTGVSDSNTFAPVPPPPLDPVLDRASSLTIRPRFCNANTNTCN